MPHILPKSGGLLALAAKAQSHPRYKLADLIAEMPDGLPLVEGWDEMPVVGLETWTSINDQ